MNYLVKKDLLLIGNNKREYLKLAEVYSFIKNLIFFEKLYRQCLAGSGKVIEKTAKTKKCRSSICHSGLSAFSL